MPAQRAQDHNNPELDPLFSEQVFDFVLLGIGSDPAIGPDLTIEHRTEQQTWSQLPDASSPKITIAYGKSAHQVMVPVGISILAHLCILILLRELVMGAAPANLNIAVPAPSMQISFRPRPVSQPESVQPETVQPEQALAAEDIVVNGTVVNDTVVVDTVVVDTVVDESAVNDDRITVEPPAALSAQPPSPAPRLLAPALLDVRDLIQNRAQIDPTNRLYSYISCDERQRRTDLIDCGEEDPNAQYNFAAAEQNTHAEFFTALNAPVADTSNQPADRTSTGARASAAQTNMTGNLGANPLIRSVMNQQ
jgi:hypothetical protein